MANTTRPDTTGSTFEQLLEGVPDAIVGVDGKGRIALVNSQTEALFGYTREQLLGMSVDALVPERFREVHPGHRAAYFAEPRTRPMGAGVELSAVREDGTEFPAEISLSGIETEDGMIAMAAIRDISERAESEREKALQEQLARARRLESVGQLAGGIAHDFNNILGVIINYAEFVADELEPGSQAHQDVGEIRRAADRAAALTRQLLIFSRREVVKPEVLYLRNVVAELENLLRRALGERVELVTRFGADLCAVEADPGQIEQVLVNLAVNARDAMPDGGRLVIEVDRTELDEEYAYMHPDTEPGIYVRLKVSDTGVGMDEDTVQHAFEPFFTTKGKGEGTGLGLATVYGIVTGAGGRIDIYSESGIGTTVKIHLPASSKEPSSGKARSRERPERQGRGDPGGRGRAGGAADGRTHPRQGRLLGDRHQRGGGGARRLPGRGAAGRSPDHRRDHAGDARHRAGRAGRGDAARAEGRLHVRLQPRSARPADARRAGRRRLHREAVQRRRAAPHRPPPARRGLGR